MCLELTIYYYVNQNKNVTQCAVYCIQCVMRVILGPEVNSRGRVVGTSVRKLSNQTDMQVFHYH